VAIASTVAGEDAITVAIGAEVAITTGVAGIGTAVDIGTATEDATNR
jgi:hypothetical protein